MSLICNYILVVARIFVNTNRGEGYEEIIPIIHIGFLDFTLFKDTPEFYSEFKIMNVKTHYVYSGKFVLHLVKHLKITEDKLAKTQEELVEKDKLILELQTKLSKLEQSNQPYLRSTWYSAKCFVLFKTASILTTITFFHLFDILYCISYFFPL